jgi:hypothetical protein
MQVGQSQLAAARLCTCLRHVNSRRVLYGYQVCMAAIYHVSATVTLHSIYSTSHHLVRPHAKSSMPQPPSQMAFVLAPCYQPVVHRGLTRRIPSTKMKARLSTKARSAGCGTSAAIAVDKSKCSRVAVFGIISWSGQQLGQMCYGIVFETRQKNWSEFRDDKVLDRPEHKIHIKMHD